MTRRALLIGAATYGITGPDHDVVVMAAALRRQGFTDVRTCRGPAATRDGILAAYEGLIADTKRGDMALAYYSGHGGYVWPTAGEDDGVARNNRQFIVPVDYAEPTAGDFRGITAVELSVLLGRLTERTDNAAVVLDCCHSGLMSRDLGELRVRRLPKVTFADLEAHLRGRLDAGLRIDLSKPLGNPHAVRVVACASEQLAVELPRRPGDSNFGLMTSAFIQALDEATGSRVSWSRLVARVRQLVTGINPHQRPEAEGPSGRILFEVDADEAAGWLPVSADRDGRFRFHGAPLLGVQVGDEFAVMPPGASEPAVEGRIAAVTISECGPTAALGLPRFDGEERPPPLGARAFRIRAVAPRTSARVPARLEAGIRGSTFARVAAADEDAPIEVREEADGSLVVRDRIGPLHPPKPAGPDAERETVKNVNRIARATALRRAREEPAWSAASPVEVEWGHVRDGEPDPLPLSGATLAVGDTFYVKIVNRGLGDVYVSLVDIGVSYVVDVVTDFAPSGVRVRGGQEYVIGTDGWDALVGHPLIWPDGLDRGAPRPETLLMLVTAEPHDVTVLRQDRARPESLDRSPLDRSPLDELLAHFAGGADRWEGYTSRDVALRGSFSARSIDFTVDPA